MKVIKKGKKLGLVLEKDDPFYTRIDVALSDDFFMNDLYFYHSSIDGWQYIYDSNQNLVFTVTNYGFDLMLELLNRSRMVSVGVDNQEFIDDCRDEDYNYEWNQ